MLVTTLNIHTDVFFKLTQASIILKKSRRDIIVILLMRIMRDIHKFRRGFATVKYQPDDLKEKWHCFPIKFKFDENEFWTDLRKVSKYSVSYLLAIAVDNYLDELMLGNKKNIYNYIYFKNYVLYREVIDGIICWQSYWGFPLEHLRTLRL